MGTAPIQQRANFPMLNSLRGVAGMTVLVHHIFLWGFAEQAEHPLSFELRVFEAQAPGVPLFFLLSAFLLYGQFSRAAYRGTKVDTGTFLRRRALRILPAYYVAFAVLAFWPGLQQLDAKSLPADLLLVQAWIPGYSKSGIGPTWTLCAELAFYLALPVLALISVRPQATPERILRRQLALCAALWLGSVGFHSLLLAVSDYSLGAKFGYLHDSPPAVFRWFALGMILAALHSYRQATGKMAQRDLTWLWWLAALGLILVSAAVFSGGYATSDPVARIFSGLAAFCILAPVAERHASPPIAERIIKRVPGLAWIGLISYGIFLWQFPLLQKIAELMLVNRTLASEIAYVAVSLAVCIGMGAASWYLLEKPLSRLKGRRLTRPDLINRRPSTRVSRDDGQDENLGAQPSDRVASA